MKKQIKNGNKESGILENMQNMVNLILKVIPVAMGVGVLVLSIMKELDMYSGFSMLGIGMACLGISLLRKDKI